MRLLSVCGYELIILMAIHKAMGYNLTLTYGT